MRFHSLPCRRQLRHAPPLISGMMLTHSLNVPQPPEKKSLLRVQISPHPPVPPPRPLSVCLRDPLLNQNRHLRPEHNGPHCSSVKGGSMRCAKAACGSRLTRPPQTTCTFSLLIEEHSYAWVTSSKVPGGCGKGPVSKCGPSVGARSLTNLL